MPPDRTPRDTEPAPGTDAESAGSVVVGPGPSAPGGVAVLHVVVDTEQLTERLNEATRGIQRMGESLMRTTPTLHQALHKFGRSWERARSTAFEFGSHVPGAITASGDAMNWSPQADGEETPPCPA